MGDGAKHLEWVGFCRRTKRDQASTRSGLAPLLEGRKMLKSTSCARIRAVAFPGRPTAGRLVQYVTGGRLGLVPVLLMLLSLGAPPATASEAASGQFRASRSCEAYLSFNKGTNPGVVKVRPGADYEIREVNTREAHWLRIQIPDVNEPLRWVAAECGVASGLAFGSAPAAGGGSCSQPGLHDSYVLAVTWQPGFCEHFKYNGTKPECDNMADGRLVVSNLTLHGLWPNRKQCGTKYADCGNTPLSLSEDTVSYIAPWMPNFFFETTFGNYEWKKHGTCQTTMDANTYFRRAVNAVRTVNDSAAGQYIRANIGGRISLTEFLKRVGEATGLSSPQDHVGLLCAGEYLQEIRVRLPLNFREGSGMRELLGTSASEGRMGASCPEDIRIEASGKN